MVFHCVQSENIKPDSVTGHKDIVEKGLLQARLKNIRVGQWKGFKSRTRTRVRAKVNAWQETGNSSGLQFREHHERTIVSTKRMFNPPEGFLIFRTRSQEQRLYAVVDPFICRHTCFLAIHKKKYAFCSVAAVWTACFTQLFQHWRPSQVLIERKKKNQSVTLFSDHSAASVRSGF